MNRAALRRLLLELFGSPGVFDVLRLQALGQADWQVLNAMAAQHRLQPLLHAAHRENPAIPAAVRDEWRMAHRTSAMESLVWQAELAECLAALTAAGFAPIALKGAWLARHAYPEAALRPLRDLDLLVTGESVMAAFDCLLAAGCQLAAEPEMTLAECVALDKHMPQLIGPRGTMIELHHRLWEPDGRLDHATPAQADAALRRRAVVIEGFAYPAPEDMLAHLIVHAVHSHRLDCGPLVLADIHYLIATSQVDFAMFWKRAASEGWLGAARLMLDLARQFHGTADVCVQPFAGPPPPSALVASAPDLMLQNLDTRRSAGVMAAAGAGGPGALLRRIAGRRATRDGQTSTRQMAREGGYLGWAWSRLKRTVRELADGEVRRQSRDLAGFSRWIGK